MLSFKSISDLNSAVLSNLWRLPRDIDVVVGIPRSGLLVASMVALYLNVPLTDIDGLLVGRLIRSGARPRSGRKIDDVAQARTILVIDDSVGHGTQMRAARSRLAMIADRYDFLFAAAYVTPESRGLVDYAFEILPWGHLFAWNCMHHQILERCCVDIDGVLCRDPSSREDDDGEEYLRFLRTAEPLHIPSIEVGWLVTCRLEKYRQQTEGWLHAHGVRYRSLIMMDLPSKEARIRAARNAAFKAEAYRSTGAALFLESCPIEAAGIAQASGMPALCVSTQEMMYPGIRARIPAMIRRSPWALRRRVISGLHRAIRGARRSFESGGPGDGIR